MQAREMSESEPLAEKARRLTQKVYKTIEIARVLRARAEQVEKESWKLLEEIKRYEHAGK